MTSERSVPHLSIRRVVLYKHGLGYFEMRGTITGDQQVSLFFPQRQMNDVLKSLSVLDPGGRVGAVEYENTAVAGLDSTAWTDGLDATETFRDLLQATRGARVQVQRRDTGPVRGRIVGLDQLPTPGDKVPVNVDALVLKVDGDQRIEAVSFLAIESVEFLDLGFTHRLDTFLENTFAETRADAKAVTFSFHGDGEREAFLCYTVEAPAWKTSYRLLLRDDDDVMLQGWALVDNATDQDWLDVDISLMSGLPVSFRYNIYPPLLVERPEIEVKTSTGVTPYDSEEALDDYGPPGAAMLESGGMPAPSPKMRRRASRGGKGGAKRSMALAADLDDAISEAAPAATGEKTGDFFAYHVDQPITVRRNQSALVPIVNGPLEGERVVIFNESSNATNPMAGLQFTNGTGLTLDEGPATVFADGAYVGEAMLPLLAPDEKRLVAWAVDLGTRVTVDRPGEKTTITKLGLLKNEAVRRTERVDRRTVYTFRNKDSREKTVLVEHPKSSGWHFADDLAIFETTDNLVRLKFTLPPDAAQEFEVAEHKVRYHHVEIGSYSMTKYGQFADDGLLSDDEFRVLSAYLDLAPRIEELETQLRKVETDRDRLDDEQQRMRANLKALGTSSEEAALRKTYVKQLSAHEKDYEDLKKQAKAIEKQLADVCKEQAAIVTDFVTAQILPEARKSSGTSGRTSTKTTTNGRSGSGGKSTRKPKKPSNKAEKKKQRKKT